MILHTLRPEPNAHYWHITLSFAQQEDVPAVLKLANWVPGSYTIRDFARHIVEIHAECDGRPAALIQTAKNTWHTAAQAGEWRIRYTVYAYDLSVRAAYLTAERGFFDGACLFFAIEGRLNEAQTLVLEHLPAGWLTATTLPRAAENTFQTASYGELLDHPVELGRLETITFEANGIPHRIVLSGSYPDFDRDRLCRDVQRICATQLAMFPAPAPFAEYLFLLHLGDKIYGGLEHRSSTALHAGRHTLPPHGLAGANAAYTELLGLFSHEYFHAWNVKSVKPAAFAPYDLDRENHTEQLWAFEGITAYYDDLLLARSRTITPENYLGLLAQNITRVRRGKGRLKQTLAQSSYTAWHKYYKADENAPNAIVSYYQQGSLAALCLDLLIREKSAGAHSLDTVMRRLYLDWLQTHKGIEEGQWQTRCREITGLDLADFFQTALYTTDSLPLEECLHTAGIRLQYAALPRSHSGGLALADGIPPAPAPDFGARFTQHSGHALLTHIANGGSAEAAALCPNDQIIAVNGYACTDLAAVLAVARPGDTLGLHYFRHGLLHHTTLILQAAEADTALLHIEDADKLRRWLDGTP
ncbi:Predicted protease with the C-terminal PDZ domain [Kingella potus]|uniref:Predicted protease with the C-terminal PDZ domain n=1 Tax=Kingella potus TaxID=265175 RepID=A0A377QZY8_9NEIS|nr:PDZ domain-containing protein [Kingella potus]STR00587.1 Predicted protease with the C-terminal PDZ domain [Kingella potus]